MLHVIHNLSNGTLTNIAGLQADDADLTVTINRSDLEQTMMGAVTFDEQVKELLSILVFSRVSQAAA